MRCTKSSKNVQHTVQSYCGTVVTSYVIQSVICPYLVPSKRSTIRDFLKRSEKHKGVLKRNLEGG